MSVFYNSEINESTYTATYPNSTEQVFEIQTQNRLIKFSLARVGNTGTATLSALSNNVTNENIFFYVNGQLTPNPTIDVNTWTTIGIVFTDPLLFNSYAGEFNIVGELSIDNFSYYQVPANILQELSALSSNLFPTYWSNILLPLGSKVSYTWGDWDGSTWQSILTYFGSTAYSISPEGMYNSFTGTDILVGSDQYTYLNNVYTTALYPIANDFTFYSGVKSQRILYTPS
jgi:hypothetical protein